CSGIISKSLYEHFPVEAVCRPPWCAHDPDFLLCLRTWVLPELYVFCAPLPARVAHVGITPQDQRSGRQQELGVGPKRLLRKNGSPGLRHNCQTPGRELDSPHILICEAMKNSNVVVIWIKSDLDLLDYSRRMFDRLRQFHPVAFNDVLNG